MKRYRIATSFILIISLILLFLPGTSYAATENVAAKPRVVVNGRVNEIKGYLIGGEYYFTPQDITQVMSGSSKPFTTATIDSKTKTVASATVKKVKYYKMRDIAKVMNFSYTHDTVLAAAYIWTDLAYDENEQIAATEIDRAKDLKFVAESMLSDLSKQITFKEYCKILRTVINTYDSKLVSKWDKVAKKAAASNLAMTRGDGMLAIFEAAVVMKMNTFNSDWTSLNEKIGTKCWDELSNRDRMLFSNFYDKNALPEIPDFNFEVSSYFYSFGRKSLITQETIFDYNESANTMLPDKALTRKDAIKAAVRLYESSSNEKMVPLSEIGSYNKTIITDELLSYASEMPEPTADKLPYYTGFCIESKGGNERDGEKFDQVFKSAQRRQWNEKDIRMTSEWGFHYLRMKEDYEYLFDEAVTVADLNEFEKIDYLIAWALKYRVHIDFQLEDYPGWANKGDRANPNQDLDYFNNPIKQERTKQIWAVIAKRYKDIPNNVLTFSINHEIMNLNRASAAPRAVFTQDDVYNTTMELVTSIRAIDKDRLMFFESAYLGNETPLATPYMKDADLVQTFKNVGTNAFQYWNFRGLDGYEVAGYLPNWPKVQYDLSRGLNRRQNNNGVQTPSLSFDGSLYQDAEFFISIEQADSGSFVVKADDQEIYSQTITPDTKTISFTLKDDTKKLDIYFDSWLTWSAFNIKLPKNYEVKKRWYYGSQNAKTSEIVTSEIIMEGTFSSTTEWNYPYTVTLKDDLTYTTDGKKYEVGKETLRNAINSWVQQCKEYGIVGMCNEFALSCSDDSPDILKFLDDLTSTFKEYGIGWVDYGFASYCGVMNNDRYGVIPVFYNGYLLDVEMLKVLQKNQ